MRNETTNARLRSDAPDAEGDNTMADEPDTLATARAGGKKSAALRREQAETLDAFRVDLLQRLGNPDPVQRALVESACALYAVILKRSRLSAAPNHRVNPLALSAATTGLRTALKELGLLRTTELDDANTPPGGGLADYLAGKTRSEGDDDAGHS